MSTLRLPSYVPLENFFVVPPQCLTLSSKLAERQNTLLSLLLIFSLQCLSRNANYTDETKCFWRVENFKGNGKIANWLVSVSAEFCGLSLQLSNLNWSGGQNKPLHSRKKAYKRIVVGRGQKGNMKGSLFWYENYLLHCRSTCSLRICRPHRLSVNAPFLVVQCV